MLIQCTTHYAIASHISVEWPVNPNKDYDFETKWTRTPAGNTGLAKVAVQFSGDTFVVKISTFENSKTLAVMVKNSE